MNAFHVKHPFVRGSSGVFDNGHCRFLVVQDEMCKRHESDPVHD